MITEIILLTLLAINNIFLIVLLIAFLPKRIRKSLPQRPKISLPKFRKKEKSNMQFLEDVPISELKKELFKK